MSASEKKSNAGAQWNRHRTGHCHWACADSGWVAGRGAAGGALVAAGLDVLYTDATAVFVRDAVPYFMGQPAEVQVMLQRDDWPQDPVRSMGTSVNAGFIYLRSREGSRSDVVRLVQDAVDRGLIEFYLRWNNIPDQYGWAYVLSGSGVRPSHLGTL